MTNRLWMHSGLLGVLGVLLIILVVVLIAVRQSPSQADTGMPPAQRSYWQWVGAISDDPKAALETGFGLLQEHPDLRLLYLRLAEVCLEAGTAEDCRASFAAARPSDSLAHLYRKAALARVLAATEADTSGQHWMAVAQASALDPTLARLIVDQGMQRGQGAWLDRVLTHWEAHIAGAATAVGPLFGLGYRAALYGQWDTAETLLNKAAIQAPDDPHIYRELGRIYFFTEQLGPFEAALEEGIRAAEARHDLEQQLILRGNLGWHLVNRSGDLQKAEQLLTEALSQSRALSDKATEAYNLYRLGTTYLRQARYDQALAYLDSADVLYAEHVPHRQAEVWGQRGTALTQLFRFHEAEDQLHRAIYEAERRGAVDVKIGAYLDLARLKSRMGLDAESREIALLALQLAQEHQTKEAELRALSLLGRIEYEWGNFERTSNHFGAGLKGAQEVGNGAYIRWFYNWLGRTALALHNTQEARINFDALNDEAASTGQSIVQVQAYLGQGRVYHQFKNYDEALRYYDLALAQLDIEEDDGLRFITFIEKAEALAYQGSFDEAISVLREAESLAADDSGDQNQIEATLGHVYLRQGIYREALRHLRQAEELEQSLNRPSLHHWHVLYAKAVALWRLGDVDEAEQAFAEAVDFIETFRENLHSSSSRSSFVQNKIQVYEQFAAFLEEQGKINTALHYVERARSRSLVDLLYTTQQARGVASRQGAERAMEINLRMQALARELAQGLYSDEGEPSFHATRMAQLQREYERADSLYAQASIDLAAEQPLFTFNPLSAPAIQQTLRHDEALVLFDLRTLDEVHGAASSVAYVVLPDSVMVVSLPVDVRTLVDQVRIFRERIGDTDQGPGEGWEPWARRLYANLMEPVVALLPEAVEHVHIVPEGMLHYLPFAALLSPDERFLVEQFTLSVAPSATLLELSRRANPQRWQSMLLLGDPNGQLPGSRREVQAIAAAGADDRRLVLLSEQATQANLEQHVGNYDILHFATHGRFVSRQPMHSHLALYGDEVLSVEEIGGLDLQAYLVTLSACESALGGGLFADVPNGDEWVGLSQAFLAAGTPTVMATLWPISDQASGTFMVQFYDYLETEGKALALAKVQRQFARNSRMEHPFYWAPFVVIGDPL